MRAVAVRKTGDTPELMELSVPRPGPGEVLIELVAASVNPIDVGIAEGFFEGRMPHVYPLVLGVDGTGRVAEAGEAVRGLEPGDTVHGQFLRAPLGNGTFADYAVVTEFPDASGIALINSVGATAGFISPYMVGWIQDASGGSVALSLSVMILANLGAIVSMLALLSTARRERRASATKLAKVVGSEKL